jgi:hypothetical protein
MASMPVMVSVVVVVVVGILISLPDILPPGEL